MSFSKIAYTGMLAASMAACATASEITFLCQEGNRNSAEATVPGDADPWAIHVNVDDAEDRDIFTFRAAFDDGTQQTGKSRSDENGNLAINIGATGVTNYGTADIIIEGPEKDGEITGGRIQVTQAEGFADLCLKFLGCSAPGLNPTFNFEADYFGFKYSYFTYIEGSINPLALQGEGDATMEIEPFSEAGAASAYPVYVVDHAIRIAGLAGQYRFDCSIDSPTESQLAASERVLAPAKKELEHFISDKLLYPEHKAQAAVTNLSAASSSCAAPAQEGYSAGIVAAAAVGSAAVAGVVGAGVMAKVQSSKAPLDAMRSQA